jgi:CheY-like chemotaxis protein
LAGVRVLIVEDNATNRHVLHCYLSSQNMEVASAASGSEALEILEQAEPDAPYQLAIVDMKMPGMDGLALARSIKASPRGAHIRVIVLTLLGEMLSGEACLSVDACLVKPVKQFGLYDSLVRVLANHSTGAAVVVDCAAPPQKPEPGKTVRILLAEDNPVNRIVALAQLKQMGYKADMASNGQEVLHLLRQTPYEIILMDCQMPDMDGYETTRRIRAAGDTLCQPYIIALTAHATPLTGEKCFEAGMNDYVSKPVKLLAFTAALAKGVLARAAGRGA